MLTTSTLFFLPLAAATPFLHPRAVSSHVPQIPNVITLSATGTSANAPIKDSPITASDGGFFINRPTVAFPCPSPAHCSLPTNITALTIYPNTTATLASAGITNQIFVNGSSGALSYNRFHGTRNNTAPFNASAAFVVKDPGLTTNHSKAQSNSSDIAAGFATLPPLMGAGGLGRFGFDGGVDGRNYTGFRDFWACPNGEEDPVDVYRVFVADERLGERCFGIEVYWRGFGGGRGGKAAWGY